jgi:hypothetical protein
MIRALSVTCVSLLCVGLAGSTALAAKPSIAVLGLEVVDPGGTPTPRDTEVAKQLTNGLRQRARAGTGMYQYAPGSEKELIDEKLLNNCSSEAVSCMVAIGRQVGADRLVYGKIERLSRGYQVTIQLLDVTNGKRERPVVDMIALSEASGSNLQVEAKRIYAKLTGETGVGSLVVKVSGADRGVIDIDGSPQGTITSGTGEVSGLSEGRHRLTVEIGGFHRWEKTIQITAGQTTNVPVDDLERSEVVPDGGSGDGLTGTGSDGGIGIHKPAGGGSHATTWKAVGWGALAVSAVAGGVWAYSYAANISSYKANTYSVTDFTNPPMGSTDPSMFANSDNCGNTALRNGTGKGNKAFDKACSSYSITKIAIPVTISFGIAGIGALIWA